MSENPDAHVNEVSRPLERRVEEGKLFTSINIMDFGPREGDAYPENEIYSKVWIRSEERYKGINQSPVTDKKEDEIVFRGRRRVEVGVDAFHEEDTIHRRHRSPSENSIKASQIPQIPPGGPTRSLNEQSDGNNAIHVGILRNINIKPADKSRTIKISPIHCPGRLNSSNAEKSERNRLRSVCSHEKLENSLSPVPHPGRNSMPLSTETGRANWSPVLYPRRSNLEESSSWKPVCSPERSNLIVPEQQGEASTDFLNAAGSTDVNFTDQGSEKNLSPVFYPERYDLNLTNQSKRIRSGSAGYSKMACVKPVKQSIRSCLNSVRLRRTKSELAGCSDKISLISDGSPGRDRTSKRGAGTSRMDNMRQGEDSNNFGFIDRKALQ